MSVDIEPRKTGAYTGNANILDNHPPLHLHELNSRVWRQMLKLGLMKLSSHGLPIKISFIRDTAPMWQSREVEFIEKRLKTRKESLK